MTERRQTKTVRLYETDSSISEFEATVLSCEGEGEGYAVTLDRTAFFPTGGGQTCDTGYIGTARVYDVTLRDCDAVHMTDRPLKVGEKYICTLDYAERLSKMRSHTAEHILSSYLFALKGYVNVGFHLGSADTTCDFDGYLTEEELVEAEKYVNRIIMENHPVYATFPDGAELENISYRSKLELEGDIRLVNVGEGGKIDICACCAPHVLTTGQIGVFVIVDAYHYKGGTRIHMLVSDRALERIRSERECVRALSRMLSVKPLCDEVLSGVERLGKENTELKNAVNEGKTALAEAISSSAEAGKPFYKVISESDADLLRKIAIGAREKNATTVAVFGGGDGSYRFVICGDDAQTLLAKIKALGGKGGGKDVICGSVSCTEDAIAELMK